MIVTIELEIGLLMPLFMIQEIVIHVSFMKEHFCKLAFNFCSQVFNIIIYIMKKKC